MIAAILEHYGADLTRVRDTGWRPLKCPFHADSHASASVNLEAGAFRCHTCGMKGDAIALVRRQENLDYREALSFAEQVSGETSERIPYAAKEKERRQRWRHRLFD